MATYYISPTGNDSTGNGSSATPWLTLTKANASSAAGDTIILLAGAYTWTTANYGMAAERTYQGADPTTTFLDAGGGTISGHVLGAASYITTIKNLTFRNAVGPTAGGSPGMFTFGARTIGEQIFENCIFQSSLSVGSVNNGMNGMFAAAYGTGNIKVTFRRCAFIDIKKIAAATYGFFFGMNTSAHTQIFIFESCTIYCAATGSSKLTSIFNINNDNGANTVSFKNSILQNAAASLSILQGSTSTTLKTATYSCFNGTLTNTPAYGAGVITSDPLFVDAASGNLQLRPGSPCLDTGTLS